jgi:hypothetical protein
MSEVEIPEGSGNFYKYVWNPETKNMDYRGPVGDAPPLQEEMFKEVLLRTRKEIKAWSRKTWDNKKGKWVVVPADENVYIGKDVKDVGEEGFSNIGEVTGILREMSIDLREGAPRAIVQARSMRLKGIIEQSKRGPIKKKKNKIEAIRRLNKWRAKQGWGPVSEDIGPIRPTKKQREAPKERAKFAKTRKFTGDIYELEGVRGDQKVAQSMANKLRNEGYKVRVVPNKEKTFFGVYKNGLRER